MQQTRLPKHSPITWWMDSFFLLLILGWVFFLFLGTRPLFVPDEGRYAEIAREMASRSDYVTPYLNGIKYFEKPALFYWLGSFAIKLMGVNLWSVRSINGLIGVLGCLLTYLTARKLYDRQTGLLASFILGTSLLYFVMSHMVSLDLPVTVFLAATLYFFLIGIESTRHNLPYFWLSSSCAALAVLTKGLIGIVFPILIIGSWLTILGEWKLLKRIPLASSLVIFLLIALPWHLLVSLRNPEFFHFYFIEQHILRYTMREIGHYQPVWFFIPCLLIGFFPWIAFLPQTFLTHLFAWKERKKNKKEIFFLLWIGLVFIFFSFSKSKLIPYILPIFPPLAILTARYLMQPTAKTGIKIGLFFLLFTALLGIFALYYLPFHLKVADPLLAKRDLYWVFLTLVFGFSLSLYFAFSGSTKAYVMLVSTMAISLILLAAGFQTMDTRTIRPLAMTLKPLLTSQDDVITFNQYYQDLPFYLQRRVSILNWRNELTFGMQFQDTRDWMLSTPDFWNKWHSSQRIFVIMSREEFESFKKNHSSGRYYLLNQTISNVLISNKTPDSNRSDQVLPKIAA